MNRLIPYIGTILALTLLLMSSPVHAKTLVMLKDQAKVKSRLIHLGDIAKVRGDVTLKLSSMLIAKFPRNLDHVLLSKRYIKDKIVSSYKDKIQMYGPDEIRIMRSYVNISKQTLQNIFTKTLIAKNPWHHRGEIKIKNFNAPLKVRVPEEASKSCFVKFSQRSRFIGPTSGSIIFGRDMLDRKIVHVSAFITFRTDIPVPRHTISRGRVITKNDLYIKHLDISHWPALVMDPRDCIGMRAKTYIKKDQPILASNIEKPPVISRGQVVLIEAVGNNIVVSDKGIALRDGYIKDTIPVKNLSSGRQVFGTVVAASRVRVEF